MSAITSCKCRTPPSLPQCFIAPSTILSKGVVFSIAQSFTRYEALQTDLNAPCTPIVSLPSILSLGLPATLLKNFSFAVLLSSAGCLLPPTRKSTPFRLGVPSHALQYLIMISLLSVAMLSSQTIASLCLL